MSLFLLNENIDDFHKKINPVAMAKRQIPNGYKHTLDPIKKSIKPLKEMDEIFEEDTHLRSKLLSGEQNRKDAMKVKFRRADFLSMQDPKEYYDFQKKNSSPRQYRELLRNDNKQIKSLKKKFRLSNPNFNARSFVKNQNLDMMKNAGASYDPRNRVISINKSEAIYKDPLFRHKILSHELTHKNQFDYAKAKEGKQGERRLTNNYITSTMGKEANPSFTDPKFVNRYLSNPLEYQAHKVGANINSVHDRPTKFDPTLTKLSLNKKNLKNAINSEKFKVDQNMMFKQSNIDPAKLTQKKLEKISASQLTPRFK